MSVSEHPKKFIARLHNVLLNLSRDWKTSVRIKETDGEKDIFLWDSKNRKGTRYFTGERNETRVEYLNQEMRLSQTIDDFIDKTVFYVEVFDTFISILVSRAFKFYL